MLWLRYSILSHERLGCPVLSRNVRCLQDLPPRFASIAARKKAFQEKKADFQRKKAQVTARVREAKNLARERINIYRENIFTIPNVLSVTRIVCTPLLGYWVYTGAYASALGLFGFAAASDMLDGQIARRWPSQQSMAGTVLDPLADKLLVGTLFLTLTYAHIIPLPLTVLIVCRDVSLMGGSLYLRYKSLPKPKTLARFFDPSLTSMRFEPTFLSKANTSIQLLLVACSLGAPVFDFVAHPCLQALCYLTATTTALSGVEYAIRRDTYRFLHKTPFSRRFRSKNTSKDGTK